jgi:hypothetical protein
MEIKLSNIVETRIKIIRVYIKQLKHYLTRAKSKDESDELLKKIEHEESNLEKLQDNYPEYFI